MRIILLLLALLYCLAATAAETPARDLLLAAMGAYRDHRYQEAVNLLDRIPEGEPDANVELFRGTALYYLNRLPESRAALLRALRLPGDGYVKETAQYFLERIQEDFQEGYHSTRHPFWMTLDLAAGYNSNVLDDPATAPPIGKPQFDTTLTAGYTFLQGQPFFVKLLYAGSYEDDVNYSANRATNNALSAPLTYQSHGWLVQATPSFQYQTYTERFETYSEKPSVATKLQWGWGAGDLGVAYQTTRISAPLAQYSYLAGREQQEKAYLDFNGSRAVFTVSCALVKSDVGDETLAPGVVLPNAYHAVSPGLALYWTPGSRWEISANVNYSHKIYNDIVAPDLKQRVDDEIFGQAKISFRISDRVRIFTQVSPDVNFSNFGPSDVVDKNYRQIVTEGGISWDIFR